jgi:hypothetical protein
MATSRGSRFRIKRAKRSIQALELRESGLTYRAIGEEIGCSEQYAWRMVMEELDRLNQQRAEKAEAVLTLELRRLDTMFNAVWDLAKSGDQKAIGTALKITEKRAALLGLNLVRHEVKVTEEHTVNVVDLIDQYANELQLEAGPCALPCDPPGNGSRQPLDQTDADPDPEPVPGVRTP